MRVHRLIAILLLIESRGQMKAKDLARALETSTRTIYRDVDALCESGVPLVTTTGPNGGIGFVENYRLDMNRLYRDDVVNLYLSGIGFHPDGGGDASSRLRNALFKMEKSLPAEYRSDIENARKRFYYDEIPWWGERAEIPHFELIRKATLQSRRMRISYGRTERERRDRIIRPYGMVVKNMEWYVVGHCELSREVRTFKCERIRDAELLDGFAVPADFSLEGYWTHSADDFVRERSEAEKYPVSIRLRTRDGELLKGLEVLHSLAVGEYTCAEVNMHKPEFARDEAMDIAGKAEILAPAELREYVGKRMECLAELYK